MADVGFVNVRLDDMLRKNSESTSSSILLFRWLMFISDIRYLSALKFDSGSLTHRVTGEMIFPKTERELFRILGLPYIRPELRNADG